MENELKKTIRLIQNQIKDGLFLNEASVIRGIINPILQNLGWPIYDVSIVKPEFPILTQRVDIALCHHDQPRILIEAKKIGTADGAEKQLFEYAFHNGVPILILTDGSSWHFFLTAGRGNYEQRKVRKIDFIENEIDEIITKFVEYLSYKLVIKGEAQKKLEEDYIGVIRENEIRNTLPLAIKKLITDKDEILLELIASKVEDLCDFKPNIEVVHNFITNNIMIEKFVTNNRYNKNNVSDGSEIKEKFKPSGNLGFTRILKSQFGDINPGNRWANLIQAGIELATQKGYTINDLAKHTKINLIDGEEHERGFKFVKIAKLSYQGMDANKTWENSLKLAKFLRTKILVDFEWTNNKNAAFPGKRETLFWKP